MFINWRFDHLPEVKRQLVAHADGPLATEMRKQAEQAAIETSRRVSNQANEGTVEVVTAPNNDDNFFIVTHETAKLGDARGQAGYFVYRAAAHRVGNTYKLTSFVAVN